MRICVVYDCLFPWTVGGAERWYRNLAERLASDGHEITYLTRRQWDVADAPDIPGVRVVAVSREEPLYGPDGNRRIGQALRFGGGVLRHLWRHGGDYDAVHTCSFPYFSLLGATVARPRHRYRLVTDWFEVWSDDYWRSYLGGVQGWVGWLVQALCVRVPQRANCFSRLHAARLKALGLRGEPHVLRGLFAGATPKAPGEARPEVVFAGRHIAEKRAEAIPAAIATARRDLPDLRGRILGDGPRRDAVLGAIAEHEVADVVEAPGFVDGEVVEDALAHALCLLLPSEREGYGMVVIEAAAHGTPSVVVAAPDNAAVELIDEGHNGYVAATASPQDLASAIVLVAEGGEALRERTRAWYERHRDELSLESSLQAVEAAYGSA